MQNKYTKEIMISNKESSKEKYYVANLQALISKHQLVVVDDFYPDPDAVREQALKNPFFQYSPPDPSQVQLSDEGAELGKPTWLSSALKTYWGNPVKHPQQGYRYNSTEVVRLIESSISQKVDMNTWDTMGDWWNGAFHIQFEDKNPRAIHHHFKAGDIEKQGWSGLVYLSKNAPKSSGTSIWVENSTGLCTANKGPFFRKDVGNFTKILQVKNVYNRLVLFRENILHQAANGFGNTKENGRLTQTFFFEILT